MSSNNPESQGQDWPIYPGTPGGQAGSTPQPQSQPSRPEPPNRSSEPPLRSSEPPLRSSEPVEERYAQDDAYKAYQSYVHPTQHRQIPEPVEGSQPGRPSLSRPSSSSALQKKYVWIAIGIVAAVVITSIARGGFNLWPVIIFAGIAWWVMGNKRKC